MYTNDLQLSNGIGDYTIVEGEEDLFLYNNTPTATQDNVQQPSDAGNLDTISNPYTDGFYFEYSLNNYYVQGAASASTF